MNVCVLRKNGSKETCEGIFERISQRHNVQTVLNGDFEHGFIKPNVLIRWNEAFTKLDAPFEVNTADMVRLMNDKPATRRKLIENGVRVPKTYFSKRQIADLQIPLIGRRTHHSQGRHMKVIRNRRDLERDKFSTYWSEFVAKDREFRVFVFFGYILGVCEKKPENADDIAWNNNLGHCVFETMKRANFPLDVCLLALQTTHALGVDFAAVDIMSKGNDHYVLELNSGPTCSEYRQWLFGRAFKWLMRQIDNAGVKPKYLPLPAQINNYQEVLHPYILKKERMA